MTMPNLVAVEGKYTGPGKYIQRIEDKIHIHDNYWLYNYNIDGNQLKPEHKEILLKHVIPTLRKVRSHVKIFAYASKSGNRQQNLNLSISRALHVKKFLMSFGFSEAQVPGQEMRAAGSTFGNPGVPEDEFYRAVHVVVITGVKSQPLRPDIVFVEDTITDGEEHTFPDDTIREKPPGSRRWSIKYLDGRSVGAGAGPVGGQVTHHRFVLYNHETDQYHVATFDGVGDTVGLPSPLLASGSYTTSGDAWHRFDVDKRLEYSDFKGDAYWVEGPPGTTSYVTFKKAGVRVDVPAGVTIGIPSFAGSHGKIKVTRPGDGKSLQHRP